MRLISTFLTILLSVVYCSSIAQNKAKIIGTINDNSIQSRELTNVTLLKEPDSAVIKITATDKTGKFEFNNVSEGKYYISVSRIGYETAFSKVVNIINTDTNITLQTINIFPLAKSLATITINSKKPFIEQKAGKTIVNVEASPTNTGLNALELLQKSPGVSVDNDGNISLKGKQGVMILIDNKPTYMSGADLANLLKSMQSTALSQIEIITNPPAKYDAAGNSGIINIKTKKGIIKGMNGSANLGYTQGVYGSYNSGVNINYRNNKLNVFGGYNGGKYEGYNTLNINRNFYQADKTTISNTADQVTTTHRKGNYHNIKAGVDYYFSKKDIAGFVINTNLNHHRQNPEGDSYIKDGTGSLLYKLQSLSMDKRISTNVSSNVNYKHTFDSTGREFSADFDYVYYNNKSNSQLNTESYDADNIKTGNTVILKGNTPSTIKIYSAKVDYVHPFKKALRLETGLKSSYVNSDNQVSYLRNNGSGYSPDDRSNHFLYDENINAAYAILSKTIKKLELSGGLRLENTISKGKQVKNDSTFKRNYTNLFPNGGLTYNASEKNQFSISYSRRISRPDYGDLNPFVFFLDSLTYEQGNPYLQPQFSNNVEVSHTYKRFLTTTINYSQTNDIITELIKQDTQKKASYVTRENFNSMKQFGVAVMANMPITKWWNVNLYTNVYNNHYVGVYQNDPVDIQFTSFNGNMNNSFTLGKGWNAEVSGWFNSKATYGLLVANSMGAINTSLSKQIMKAKGTIKIGLNDVLNTQQFSGYVKYSDVNLKVQGKRDSRQFNINFSYRFGKKEIPAQRRKTGGAGDEENRIKSRS